MPASPPFLGFDFSPEQHFLQSNRAGISAILCYIDAITVKMRCFDHRINKFYLKMQQTV